ncbi:helix-turn-helix domain-containing protein [Kineosporia babensis]|uniref:Helix-turn-helix domain-containing protein n=1 Tax=Kineosporia babensis TaxID=499548 RepID=A0A9X1NKW7_9ACTN|nr:helix-turn-helix transcriptional regulator [Kineosporia babensis]MCD5316832.1 helix-turn-helix domain-containing protein [Kineosporia babensis]
MGDKPQSKRSVRRSLARQVRALREAAGLSHRDLADAGAGSVSKWKRIEKAETRPSPGDILHLCRIIGADEETTANLEAMAKQDEQVTWYVDLAKGLPNDRAFFTLLELEAFATSIDIFGPMLVPGLVQSHRYQVAQFQTAPDGFDEETINRQVAVRTRRQEAMASADLCVVVGEEVLHRQVGGPEGMEEQIAYLRQLNALPNVDIRVLPFSVGAHPGGKGEFALLGFSEESQEPDVLHTDGYLAAQYSADTEPVRNARRRFAIIKAKSVPIEEHLQCVT